MLVARLRIVRKSYDALRTAYTLVNGEVKDLLSPRNVSIFLGFISFLNDAIFQGPKSISEACHQWRERALTKIPQELQRVAEKLFLASTLARSVPWENTIAEKQTAVEKTTRIWMTPHSYKEDSLEHYISKVLPISRAQDEPRWPMPNQKACLTRSCKQGGMARALVENRYNELADDLERYFRIDSFAASVTPPSMQDIVNAAKAHEEGIAIQGGVIKMPGNEVLTRYLRTRLSELKPVPIRGIGGKIRVVTLHPADEVLVARRLTQLWLKQLRRFVVTREMLRNEVVTLEPESPGSLLFSADLSNATDHISHGLAQRTARLLNERLGRPQDDAITDILFGKHKIQGTHDETVSGIHMGLGPTWIILSILNSYAAWRAGARCGTYRICGDDLIGYWPSSIRQKYISVLEELGLVVNRTKCYTGRRGVFCERIVQVSEGGFEARARDVGHLSAMTASKLAGGFTHAALAVADGLEKIRSLHPIVDRVRRRLAPKGVGSGRIRLGGNGFGNLDNGGLFRLAKKGALHLVIDSPLPTGLLDGLEPQIKGQVAIPDLIISLKSAIQATCNLAGIKLINRPMSREEFKASTEFGKSHRNLTAESLRTLIRNSPLNTANKKRALQLLKRGIPPSRSRLRHKLENVLSRPAAVRYTSRENAERILKKMAPPGWEIRTLIASN